LKKDDPNSTLTFNYTISGTTIKKDGVNDVVVEGDRVDTVKPEDLLAAQQNGQGLGVFIIR